MTHQRISFSRPIDFTVPFESIDVGFHNGREDTFQVVIARAKTGAAHVQLSHACAASIQIPQITVDYGASTYKFKDCYIKTIDPRGRNLNIGVNYN